MRVGIKVIGNFFLFVFICFISSSFKLNVVQAEELPPGMVIGDSQGINATSQGVYQVHITDVLPGGNWHTTVTLLNMEKDTSYHLTMLISPSVVSGRLDLSKELQMTLTYEGEVVYKGSASGISKTKNLQTTLLDLGIFEAGDSRGLEVDYSLSGEYSNEDFVEKNVMDNSWTYYAIKTDRPTESTELNSQKPIGRFPSTGEIKQGMIFVCLGLFLLLLILLIWKKKERK